MSFFLVVFVLAVGGVAVRNAIRNIGELPKGGLHAQMDTRRRRPSRPAAPYRASRLPPPPSGRPSSLPPPPPSPGDEPVFRTSDPAELDEPAAAPDEAPGPEPIDEQVVHTSAPDEAEPTSEGAIAHEPAADPEPEPPAEPETEPGPDASLDLVTVIRAVFGDDGSARERADRFQSEFAARRVSWTAQALRSFPTRRDRVQVERVELFLGHTTDEERFSDRVMAEAFFAEGTEIERDADITFTATLAEANVYARRLVLDHAEIS